MHQGLLSIDGDRARLPASVFDHAGFRIWATSSEAPENVRVAFIGGEVLIDMSPESLESHAKPKAEITSVLVELVKREDLGEAYPDRSLVTNEAAALSAEPDLVFVSWATFEAGRVRLVPKAGRPGDSIEIVGTPDLVVEIVSDSSTRKDTKLLRDAYARAGVPEYWLVDARPEQMSFVILRLEGERYEATAAGGDPQASVILRRGFALRREPNRAGRWRYSLDVVAV